MATKKEPAKKTTAKKTEPKKDKPAPKKDTRVWHDGHPMKTGVYECKLDGKDLYLIWLHCDICSKHGKWSTMDGQLPIGKKIEWTGEPVPRNERV